MGASILGLGVAVPPHTMSVDEAVEIGVNICSENATHARQLSIMFKKSGVQNRHTCVHYTTAYDWVGVEDSIDTPLTIASSSQAGVAVETMRSRGPSTAERMRLYGVHAAELGMQACRRALTEATVAAGEITHLVTVSCTGFEAPGVDLKLIAALGMPSTVQRVHVGFMGCHGAINGMRVAQAIALSDPNAKVLLCAVELCSLHFCMTWDPEKMVANALFGDGAGALVIAAQEQPADQSADNARADQQRIAATGSCIVPESADAMSWRVGEHGFDMTLAPRVPSLIEQSLKPWLTDWLDQQGLAIEDVGHWCVHPGGPKILRSVTSALALPAEATQHSRDVLYDYGNMSSPTVLFILQRILQQPIKGPIVMIGFGPGLIAEAALLR